jgi:hypothetical protein
MGDGAGGAAAWPAGPGTAGQLRAGFPGGGHSSVSLVELSTSEEAEECVLKCKDLHVEDASAMVELLL